MMTDNERAEVVREYEAGASIEALAAEHGCGYGTIRAELLRAGVTLRRRGGRRPSGGPVRTRVSAVLPSYGVPPQGVS